MSEEFPDPEPPIWLALSVGNSRHHWAVFRGQQLQITWDIPNSDIPTALVTEPDRLAQQLQTLPGWPETVPLGTDLPPLWLASVVPDYSQRWQAYPCLHSVSLEHIPLGKTYPSLGIDRALAVWGAGLTYGFPVLVIDAGTALTFSGADAERQFCGGAILPGLGLQFRALARGTAALPELHPNHLALPLRWGLDTPMAIRSGILYTVLAGVREFIEDWQRQYPDSAILLTGGEGEYLGNALEILLSKPDTPDLASTTHIRFDPNLIFIGLATIVNTVDCYC